MSERSTCALYDAETWGWNAQAAECFRGWKEHFDSTGEEQPLMLVDCSLKVIPPEVFDLPMLKDLYCRLNPVAMLPREIGRSASLRYLVWSNNFSRTLPAELGLVTGLKTLDCSHNLISRLPAEITNLVALKELLCSENSLDELPEEMERMEALEVFTAFNNLLTSIPRGFAALPNLRTLFLSSNRLDEASLFDIADGVRRSSTIKVAHLSDNPGSATHEVACAFERALRSNASLQTLTLTVYGGTLTSPPRVGEEIQAALERNKRGEPAPEPYSPMIKAARKS